MHDVQDAVRVQVLVSLDSSLCQRSKYKENLKLVPTDIHCECPLSFGESPSNPMCMLLPIFCYFLAAKIKKIQFSCSFIYGQVSPLSRFAYHVRYRGSHALPWYLHVPGLKKSANGRAAYHKSTVWLLGQPIAWNQKSRLEITSLDLHTRVLLYAPVIYQTDRVRAEASWVFSLFAP